MTQHYVTPAFIFISDHFILPCRFALIQNGVQASQHLRVIGNGGCCYGSFRLKYFDILSAF